MSYNEPEAGDRMNYDEFFPNRLAELRMQADVSAREMSLALGQNASYINRIENRQAFPSMQNFFYICDYLGVTPKDFFDESVCSPVGSKKIFSLVEKLDEEQLNIVYAVVNGLLKTK